jgi:hypothetical protein
MLLEAQAALAEAVLGVLLHLLLAQRTREAVVVGLDLILAQEPLEVQE